MLTRLRRLLHCAGSRAVAREPASLTAALAEPLEKRSLLSAAPASAAQEADVTGPTLVNEQLLGSDPRAATGVVLTFSEPLDEASAEDLRNYRIGVRTDRRQRFFDDDDRFRFRRNRGLIRFESAVYDPATLTVTLTALQPFNITTRFRNVRVLAREAQGVRDVAGNLLDGNEDGVPGRDALERFTFRRGGRVPYGESDGDSVALRLSGPGLVWVVRKTRGGRVLARGDAVRVYIERGRPGESVLTGKVRQGGNGDGVARIEELVNTSTADIRIAGDPAFNIVNSIA